MVQFGAFWCIFGSDFVFKKFVVGHSHGKIIENILRLPRFGMYFEIILNIKWLFSYSNNYIVVRCMHMLGGSGAYDDAAPRKF